MKKKINHRRRTTDTPPEFVMDSMLELPLERSARYMTRTDLANETGLSVPTISNYENMQSWPRKANYNRLARLFGWKLWED